MRVVGLPKEVKNPKLTNTPVGEALGIESLDLQKVLA